MTASGPSKTLPPSGIPDEHATAEQGEAYRRRMQRTGMPVRIQRASSIFTTFSLTFLTGYAVFYADFGPHEHVFSPPRRWLDRQLNSFWSLSEEEKRTAKEMNSASPSRPESS